MTGTSRKSQSATHKRGRRTPPRRILLTKYLARRKRVRWLAPLLTLLIAALLVGLDRGVVHRGGEVAQYESQPWRVQRVIDGDTLIIEAYDPRQDTATTRVRLWGIDAPETAKPSQDVEGQPFADEATGMARQLAEGKQVTLKLEPHRVRGVYGRLLAYVTLEDGSMLNERLLAAGLARADERFSHRLNERFTLIEKQAKFEKVGLWAK